jgi:hypothetical protein
MQVNFVLAWQVLAQNGVRVVLGAAAVHHEGLVQLDGFDNLRVLAAARCIVDSTCATNTLRCTSGVEWL